MENKKMGNESDSEDRSNGSVTDKNPDTAQSIEPDTDLTSNDKSRIDSEKPVKKSSSVVRIEDYDLIANSLKDATASLKDFQLVRRPKKLEGEQGKHLPWVPREMREKSNLLAVY
jgi:hypothetical protein